MQASPHWQRIDQYLPEDRSKVEGREEEITKSHQEIFPGGWYIYYLNRDDGSWLQIYVKCMTDTISTCKL